MNLYLINGRDDTSHLKNSLGLEKNVEVGEPWPQLGSLDIATGGCATLADRTSFSRVDQLLHGFPCLGGTSWTNHSR